MTDIAKVTIEVETPKAGSAANQLDGVTKSADRLDTGVDRLLATIDRLNARMSNSAARAAKGVSANDNLGRSYGKLESVIGRVNRITGVSGAASQNNASGFMEAANAADQLRAKYNPLYGAMMRYKQNVAEIRGLNAAGVTTTLEMNRSLLGQEQALKRAQHMLQSYGDTARLERHNVGNLAAQFQDIGVSAQMGMSPMMVALQQGTQISAVLGPMGAAGALKSLKGAFLAVISPVALFTIGAVALVVAMVQFVNWVKVGQGALNSMAWAFENLIPYAVAAGAAIALIYAPTIFAGIMKTGQLVMWLGGTFKALALSIYATVGLPVLLVGAFLAMIAAVVHFRDEIEQVLGFDIVGIVENSMNDIMGVFVGGYNGLTELWKFLPFVFADIGVQIAQSLADSVTDGLNAAIIAYNRFMLLTGKSGLMIDFQVESHQFENQWAGAAQYAGQVIQDEITAATDKKYFSGLVESAVEAGDAIGSRLRDFSSKLGIEKDDKSGGKTDAEKYAEEIASIERKNSALGFEILGLGMSERASARMALQQDLLNKARARGLELGPQQVAQIKELADVQAGLVEILRNETALRDMTRKNAETTQALMDEALLVGKVGIEYERMSEQMTLAAAIRADNLTTTPDQLASLKAEADAIAMLRQQIAQSEFTTGKTEDQSTRRAEMEFELSVLGQSTEVAAGLRYEFDLIAEAKAKGIDLSQAQIDEYSREEAAIRKLEMALRKKNEALEFAKSTSKTFLKDFLGDVAKGKNLWKSFGDAALGALGKIAEKLMDKALDKLLDGLLGAGGGGGGLGGALATLFAAKGKVFNNGATKFAKGGDFTNSVVSKTTNFAFRGGLGEMGEAGPEAVVPLTRGPDGSLGVQMYGNSGGGGGRASVAISQFFTIEGAVTESDISNMVRGGVEQGQQETKRQLTTWLDEQQIDGAVV